jgi:hypothetical protein
LDFSFLVLGFVLVAFCDSSRLQRERPSPRLHQFFISAGSHTFNLLEYEAAAGHVQWRRKKNKYPEIWMATGGAGYKA